MKFKSTTGNTASMSLKEALFRAIAPDGGLLLPETLPQFSENFIANLKNRSLQEIAFELAHPFCKEELSEKRLREVIARAFNFPISIKEIKNQLFALELFHGPTLSFKDFGARFMAELVRELLAPSKHLHVLVATSGDTGSAVGEAFYGIENVTVSILFAKNKVSAFQEKQLTTIGGNVQALRVDGTFDDCQSLLSQALRDPEITSSHLITTGNSINIARLLPQAFYFFYAYGQLMQNEPLILSIPSGNFGHLISAIIAKKMGLPIHKIIACTNINDVIPHYLETGFYEPHASYATISNSMDVGNPSNFPRLHAIFDHDVEKMKEILYGCFFNDQMTQEAMREIYRDEKIILDPHSAIGYLGLKKYKENHKQERLPGVFCATAHPAKFSKTIESILKVSLHIPKALEKTEKYKSCVLEITPSYKEFKDYLRARF